MPPVELIKKNCYQILFFVAVQRERKWYWRQSMAERRRPCSPGAGQLRGTSSTPTTSMAKPNIAVLQLFTNFFLSSSIIRIYLLHLVTAQCSCVIEGNEDKYLKNIKIIIPIFKGMVSRDLWGFQVVLITLSRYRNSRCRFQTEQKTV